MNTVKPLWAPIKNVLVHCDLLAFQRRRGEKARRRALTETEIFNLFQWQKLFYQHGIFTPAFLSFGCASLGLRGERPPLEKQLAAWQRGSLSGLVHVFPLEIMQSLSAMDTHPLFQMTLHEYGI
jgi:hypothetical protein